MREIKFRAWDKEEKEMFYGVMVGDVLPKDARRNKQIYIPTEAKRCVVGFVDAEGFELMQSTGLKDKNGKEEYHKDRIRHDSGVLGTIEWDKDKAGFYYDWDDGTKSYPQFSTINDIEVIGNIHENLELLEAKE